VDPGQIRELSLEREHIGTKSCHCPEHISPRPCRAENQASASESNSAEMTA
jgi:hypothetical protein